MWKIGHSANICNFRYDKRYIGTTPNQKNNYGLPPTAFVVFPNSTSDPTWFADIGASTHVTAEMGNINSANEYIDKKKIMVGNGNKLHISYVGVTYFPTFTVKSLALNKLLHMPEIKKNHINVSQLTLDNHVYMRFHSNSCFVKDKQISKKKL